MIPILIVISVIFTSTVIVSIVVLNILYSTHISQVKSFTKNHKKGTYKDFLIEFDKVDWEYDDVFASSLFPKDRFRRIGIDECKIHAGIIEFNGKGMYMKNVIEYLKFAIFVQKIKGRKILVIKKDRVYQNREDSINSIL